jgi:4-amino-4-deoxy-L-arabinose transferase-like glycosyltransferase
MSYSLSSLAFATLFAACALVLGLGLLARLGAGKLREGPPAGLLAIPVGTGSLALILFVLAALGALRPTWILTTVTLTLAGAAYWLHRCGPVSAARPPTRLMGRHQIAVALLLGLAALLLAMSAPLEWDELAYHLPYARDYASAGGLVVSENLRYPLHSHNYQLFYAAALLFAHEPAAHLLHALSGALVAAGIYAFARHHFSQATGILAVAMFLSFSGGLFDTAYVDLGVAMFVFFSFYSFTLWQQSGKDAFLVLAAFLLAMAAGTKYQALAQVPAFALALLVAARGSWPRPAILACAVFLLFASWWYLRNWLISGDPIHPMGGESFGFWLWDEGDLAGQVANIAGYRDHLPLELAPALGFLALRGKRQPVVVSLLVVGLSGLVIWYFTSRYDRYLLPSYPFLAILSAEALVALGRRLAPRRLADTLPALGRGRTPGIVRLVAVALVAAVLVRTISAKWDEICFTAACVDRVHAEQLATPAPASAVPGFANLKLYQLGLENELYLMGEDTAGDWFGPYRYREVLALADDAGALRRHLRALGRDSLLVNRERPPFDEFSRRASLHPLFEKVYEDQRVTLYRIAAD